MTEDAGAAADARKHTKISRPVHRDKFRGSPRKLKGRAFGEWVQVGEGRWKWVKVERDERSDDDTDDADE